MSRADSRGGSSPLASQIQLWVLCTLVLTAALAAFLYNRISDQNLDNQYRLRALGIATTVAQMPEIAEGLTTGDPSHSIQAIAAKVQAQARPDYVVVTDRSGIRYSHPNPALIGKATPGTSQAGLTRFKETSNVGRWSLAGF